MQKTTEIVPLFGEVIVTPPMRPDFPVPTETDRMQAWADAFELWMSSLKSTNTQRAYRKAWDDFLAYSRKSPWMTGRSDVARWVDDMRLRGLSDCTLQQRVAGISSFYRYVTTEYTVTRADGKEVYLFDINPASGKSLRPHVEPYGKAISLGSAEARALLRAIKRNTLQGMRDYALFLTYLFTGRRNSEIRLLKWGAME